MSMLTHGVKNAKNKQIISLYVYLHPRNVPFTVTVTSQLSIRPAPSVTVYVTVLSPMGRVAPGPSGFVVIVGSVSELSLAVADGNVTRAVAAEGSVS